MIMRITSFQNSIVKKLPFKSETPIEPEPSEQKVNSVGKNQMSKEKFSFPVLATTIAGTLIPMLFIRHKQGLNLKEGALKNLIFSQKAKAVLKSFDIEYKLKEMLMVSSGSVLGGLAGGLLFDKSKEKDSKIAKVKESVFQIFNVSVPIVIGDQIVKFTEKKQWKNPLVQLATAVVAVGAGMPIAAKISNTINNKVVDKEHPDNRKLRIKDAFVHIDDFAGVIALSKIPLAQQLHVERILPFLYASCGYESGSKES